MTPETLTSKWPSKEPRIALANLEGAPTCSPFSPDAVDFCAELSQSLFKTEMKGRPEVKALAYWCRPAEITRLKSSFNELASERVSLKARGTVFHVPPVNVETLFLYGWLLSILCGNRNIVRISSRSSQLTEDLCGIVNSVLASHEALERVNLAIRYGHDDQMTANLSACCDLRIVWGGDGTVQALRSVPLPPYARDLCFPDRYSYSAICARSLISSSDAKKLALVHSFYNDCYWFDQMACSSPRLIAWCGTPEECNTAGVVFFNLLADEILRRGYSADGSVHSSKLLFSSNQILNEAVDSYATYGNELTVLRLSSLSTFQRDHCGGGLLFSLHLPALSALTAIVERRDQTLTYFGFERQELESLAHSLNGKGIDRMVPIGEALTFNRFWDGHDLLQELTRRVWVQ